MCLTWQVPLPDIDTVETSAPLAQKRFFEETLLAVAHGDKAPYKEWDRLEVVPPNPICLPCPADGSYNDDGFKVKPIKFWSYEKWEIPTPCATHGWAHSQYVTLGQWRMRRVADVFDDFYAAGRVTR